MPNVVYAIYHLSMELRRCGQKTTTNGAARWIVRTKPALGFNFSGTKVKEKNLLTDLYDLQKFARNPGRSFTVCEIDEQLY